MVDHRLTLVVEPTVRGKFLIVCPDEYRPKIQFMFWDPYVLDGSQIHLNRPTLLDTCSKPKPVKSGRFNRNKSSLVKVNTGRLNGLKQYIPRSKRNRSLWRSLCDCQWGRNTQPLYTLRVQKKQRMVLKQYSWKNFPKFPIATPPTIGTVLLIFSC